MKSVRWICFIALLVAIWFSNSSGADAAPGDQFNSMPRDLRPPNTTLPLDLTPSFDPPPPGSVPA
jgi:hypothetical protein